MSAVSDTVTREPGGQHRLRVTADGRLSALLEERRQPI